MKPIETQDIKIILKENESLQMYTEYTESISQNIQVNVARAATFKHVITSTGNYTIHIVYTIELQGPGASALLEGRLYLQGLGTQTWTVVQHHTAPDTTSNVDIKAVVADESVLNYEGTITIEKNATRSRAHQQQKNLIIGSGAQVTSIPNLQALTHDVQCGHGSAVAYFDEDHLFYLLSRGIDSKKAAHMIIEGFLQ